MSSFACIIPSRWGSTRFPGKPLVDIGGKSMVNRVYDAAKRSDIFSRIIVATDDERIFNHVSEFGECLMTPHFENGTERCFYAASKLDGPVEILVNLQGDEPFVDPSEIRRFVENFSRNKYDIGTLIRRENDISSLISRNTVKVLTGEDEENYFTRDIDLDSISSGIPIFVHVGIYAFKTKIIADLVKLKKTNGEISQSLEQLRWIENGFPVGTFLTEMNSKGIDSPEDLEKLGLFQS